jgi:hypothetical protein
MRWSFLAGGTFGQSGDIMHVLSKLGTSILCHAAAIALLLGVASEPSTAQPGAFAGLAGSWSGAGTISFSKGAEERIRCRATYSVAGGGHELSQSLRCASDSYNFDLRSDVRSSGGAITGQWSEQSRNVGGSVTGEARGNRIQVLVDSSGFSATLTLVTQGNHQQISIRSRGQELSGANISLSRR